MSHRPATWIISTLLAVISVAAAGLSMQGFLAYAETEAPPPPPGVFTAAVESGEVIETVDITAETSPEFEWLLPSLEDDDLEPVHTRNGARAGQEIYPAQVLTTIAERPVFAFEGPIPAYRAMTSGIKGPDVEQLQDSLAAAGYAVFDGYGQFGSSTALAVFNFYVDSGYLPLNAEGDPVSGSDYASAGIPFGEVQFFSTFPLVVGNDCGIQGQRSRDVVCHLTAGSVRVTAEVPAESNAAVVPGQTVRLNTTTGDQLEGTVGQVIEEEGAGPQAESQDAKTEVPEGKDDSPESQSDHDGTPGTKYVVELREINGSPFQGKATGVIILNSSKQEESRVTALAVRSSPVDGNWLELENGTHVVAEVGICAQGFCAVQGPDIHPGLEVVLPAVSQDSRP